MYCSVFQESVKTLFFLEKNSVRRQETTNLGFAGEVGRLVISLFQQLIQSVYFLTELLKHKMLSFCETRNERQQNKLSPRGRRDDMPPDDGSSTRGGSTSVRGQARSPHTAKLQAASVPVAYGSCAMGQTDGRIALFQNAHLGWGP